MRRKMVLGVVAALLYTMCSWNLIIASEEVNPNELYGDYNLEEFEFETYLKELNKEDSEIDAYSSISYEEGTAVFYTKYEGNIVAEINVDFKFSYNGTIAQVEYVKTPVVDIYDEEVKVTCSKLKNYVSGGDAYIEFTISCKNDWIFYSKTSTAIIKCTKDGTLSSSVDSESLFSIFLHVSFSLYLRNFYFVLQ